MRIIIPCLVAIGCIAARGAPAAPPDAVRVLGDVAQGRAWTPAQIERELGGTVQAVRYTYAGKEHTARAVPLVALVQAAQPRTDPARKDATVRSVVVLGAADGYTVGFGLGELLPNVGGRPAWLAFQVDGKPLPEKELPFSLLLPGETSPARWIYGVTSIRVVDGARLGEK